MNATTIKVTRELKFERGSRKEWTIFANGIEVANMMHDRDWVKGKATDRIRSKMANVSDLSWRASGLSEALGKKIKCRTQYSKLNAGADALISNYYGMRGFVSFKAAKEQLAELIAELGIDAVVK